MKVLWFVQANFDPQKERNGYNGVGWISSLRDELIKRENIELALAFFSNKEKTEDSHGVKYYSMITPKLDIVRKIFLRMKKDFIEEEESLWSEYRSRMKKIVDEFNPDVIQIFGSENKYGLVATVTQVPIVLHVQGIVAPYLNAYLPPFASWEKGIYIKSIIRRSQKNNWLCSKHCENEILKTVTNFIGRTEWDKRVIKVLSPNSNYYHGDEILRATFYDHNAVRKLPNKLTIVSTISVPLYKGFDLILKTAHLLKTETDLDFTWKVVGNVKAYAIEKLLGISHKDVNIELMGVLTAEQLKQELLNCTVYMHPSYIDNSPNSVCEAQILGVACIATNVGGVNTIIDDGETGLLVPANDPYQTAYYIKKIHDDKTFNQTIGQKSRIRAMERHNKDLIITSLLDIYNNICRNN